MITIEKLRAALIKSWGVDTAKGEWTPGNPALNQCAVTSLVVQDYFGGDLLRCLMTDGDSHYWNRVETGEEVDLSASQFEQIDPKPQRETVIIRAREYVLSFPDTHKRYEILKNRVCQSLDSLDEAK